MRGGRHVEHVNGSVVVLGVLLVLLLAPALGAGPGPGATAGAQHGAGGDAVPSIPIVVDATWHRWQLRPTDGPVGALEDDPDHRPGDDQRAHAAAVLQLRVKLMNVTQDPAGGTVVLRVSLVDDGLEQDYLEAAARLYGAQALEQALAERRHQSPRSRAILNYLERGRDLPEGKAYEPIEGAGARHRIRWRIPVRLRAGDTIEYDYERTVPDDQGGYRVEVDVEALEVGA